MGVAEPASLRVASDRVLIVNFSGYLIPVGVNRDIKHLPRFLIIVLCECDLDFVLATVVILTVALHPIRNYSINFRSWILLERNAGTFWRYPLTHRWMVSDDGVFSKPSSADAASRNDSVVARSANLREIFS
ncbi:hypothetical protein [Salinibaculum salinum]|uniref:hypothetical protein n=1 Tax=Salinibaculum salinum TaxID=3131996 RepID=UPI0030EDC83F